MWLNPYTDGTMSIISIGLDDIFAEKKYLDNVEIFTEKIYYIAVRFNKFLTTKLKNTNIEDMNCEFLDDTSLDYYELINFFIDNNLTEFIDGNNKTKMAKYKKIYEFNESIIKQEKYIIYTNGYNIFYGIQINLEKRILDLFFIEDNFANPNFAVNKYETYRRLLKDGAKLLFNGYYAIHTSKSIITYQINPFKEKSIDYEGEIEKITI